jgi:hypothetical protein
MVIETTSPQTRRALLAAGAGGLLAAVATLVGRPLAVRAVDGDPILAGTVEDASATTGVTTTGGNALQGILNAQSYDQAGSAVYAEANGSYNAYALHAKNTQGYGTAILAEAGDNTSAITARAGDVAIYARSVKALGSGGTGINAVAESINGSGVVGRASAAGGVGMRAIADLGVGLVASSGNLNPSAPANTGAYAYAAQDPSSRGVFGQTTVGRGVEGLATTGTGVHAQAGSAGTALQVNGKVRFSRSGKIAVAAGATSVTKELGAVTTASMILALFASNESGVWVRAAVPAAGSFTIYFNRSLPTNGTVAYFVLN